MDKVFECNYNETKTTNIIREGIHQNKELLQERTNLLSSKNSPLRQYFVLQINKGEYTTIKMLSTCFTILDLRSDNCVLKGPTSCFKSPRKHG